VAARAIGPDTGAVIGLRRGVAVCQGVAVSDFSEIVQAGVRFGRRSRMSMMRPSGAGKDTTPAAFLLACASGAEVQNTKVNLYMIPK